MSEVPEIAAERGGASSFLRQFARRRESVERCELCSAELSPVHQHLLDAKTRQILCSCDGCAILFCGQSGAHYLRIPRHIRALSDFQMADLEWESLMIPINLAFFYRDSAAGRVVAMYPSPAGAIESLLSLESWTAIAADHPALQTMEPDVECFLVNRVGVAKEYFIVPIDECYRLVGLIRMHWRGLSGGGEVWKEIERFFTELKSRSIGVKEPGVPELYFSIEGAEAVANAAAPLLALKLRVTNLPETESIHSLILRCQVQIEPARRRYLPKEREQLLDLFGQPERWSRTVRPLLWMNSSVSVPGFTGSRLIDLELPCTFDFNVAATKYFHALDSGEIPLCLMFSGTVFYRGAEDALQVAQVPWDREANFRLPVAVWKEMMDMHFPNTAWLCLGRDAFQQLYEYKMRHGIPTWEEAIRRALAANEKAEVEA